MCGPLACGALGVDARARRRAAIAWHAGRAIAYGAAGAILGGVGQAALAVLRTPVARALPWLMAGGLVLSACEVGRRLPALPGLGRVPRALARLGAGWSAPARAAVRGAATPFLPCGLLYGAFVMAIGTGTAAGGLTVMAAFAAGAIPALTIVQMNARRITAHPRAQRLARVVVPLLGAAVIVWRALAAASSQGGNGHPPSCH